jgi:hypothetical protein
MCGSSLLTSVDYSRICRQLQWKYLHRRSHLEVGGAVGGGVGHGAAQARPRQLLDGALPHQPPPVPLQLRLLRRSRSASLSVTSCSNAVTSALGNLQLDSADCYGTMSRRSTELSLRVQSTCSSLK